MKNAELKQNYLLHAPIAPTLKKATTPMVIGIVTIMAFSLVDTFFISLLGTNELAAIGFTYPITFILLNFTMGLSIGLNVVLARLLGKGENHQAKLTASNALIMAVLVVLSIAMICLVYIDPLFMLLGASDEILIHIKDYMIPWFLGISLLVVPMVGNGAIRATGDMMTPSIIMVIAGLINGIMDPLLIFGLGPFPEMGIQGAAIATVIAWFCSFIVAMWILIRKKQLLILELIVFKSFINSCKQVLHIGIPTATSNMLVPFATGIVTAIVAQFGESYVAGFGVGVRLEALALVLAMALSASLTTFIGQNYGAKKYDRIKRAVKISVKFLLIFQLALCLILFMSASGIANLFSNDPNVQKIITLYLQILPISYGIQAATMVIGASINSLHRPIHSLITNTVRLFVFYVPLSYLGAVWGGFTGLLIGASLSAVFAIGFSLIVLKKSYKELLT